MPAGEEKLRLVLAAIDKTAAPIRAVNRRIESMLAPVRKVRNAMRSLATEAGLPRLGRGLAKLGGLIRNLAIGGAAAGVGLLEFVRRTAEAADSLGDMVGGLGIGIEQFQEIQHAALIAGVSTEGFSKGVQKLAKNVGDLKGGTGALKTLLDKVAPSLAVQLKGATDTGEALEIMLRALRRLDDPLKRNALAVAAFGRSGQELARITSVSAEKFAELRVEARELGGAFSQDAANAAGDTTDAIDRLKFVAGGLGRTLAATLFPVITENADALRKWIAENRTEIVDRMRDAITKLAQGAKVLGEFLFENVPKAAAFIESIGGLRTVAIALGVVLAATLLPAIVTIGSALAAIGPVGIALGVYFAALGVAVGAVARKIAQNWDAIVSKIRAGVNLLPQPVRRVLGLESFAAGPGPTVNVQGLNERLTQAAGAAAGNRLDVQGSIGITLDQRGGARLSGASSSVPGLDFSLAPGRAFAPG